MIKIFFNSLIMRKNFVPSDFEVPELIKTDKFLIRMLQVKDVKLDYEAVMSSVEHLRKNPNPPMCRDWPKPTLTVERDKKDLEWHEEKHKAREVFTYTVMNLTETKCFGCIYIFPSTYKGFDAEIYFWVTKEQFDKGLDHELFFFLKRWLGEKWPFQKVIFPKRKSDGTIN